MTLWLLKIEKNVVIFPTELYPKNCFAHEALFITNSSKIPTEVPTGYNLKCKAYLYRPIGEIELFIHEKWKFIQTYYFQCPEGTRNQGKMVFTKVFMILFN